MAAEEIEQTALVASNDAGPAAMLFAATFPEKVTSLVLTNTGPRVTQNDQYPFGIPEESAADLVSLMERQWGRDDPILAQLFVPDRADDPAFVKWYAKLQRATMTPRRVSQMWEVLLQIDALPALPLIQAPTVVVALSDSPLIPPEAATFIAEKIPNARTVTLVGGTGELRGLMNRTDISRRSSSNCSAKAAQWRSTEYWQRSSLATSQTQPSVRHRWVMSGGGN